MKMRQMFPLSNLFAGLFLACTLIGLTTGQAFAASRTSIKNVANVTYDESPTPVPSNSVTTTVNLVSGLTWLDGTLSPTTQSVGPNFTLTTDYTVSLQNTGNGTTTAVISDGTSESAGGLSSGTWTINGVASPASVTLFATVSGGAGVLAGGNTTIPVGAIELTDLVPGTTVVRIGGIDYTVHADSTATALVVIGNATAVATGAGIQIGEVQTITFTGTTGGLTSISTAGYEHSMTVSDDVGGGLNVDGNTSDSDTVSSDADNGAGTAWVTTVTGGVLAVDKYVRNDTLAVVGATSLDYDGETYYKTDVSGDVGDTLEYLVVITNNGPGSASNIVMSDVLSPYVLLTNASVSVDTDGDGGFDYTGGIAGTLATLTGSTLTVYAGTGGDETAVIKGGTIAAPVLPATEVVSAIRYQVVIQ